MFPTGWDHVCRTRLFVLSSSVFAMEPKEDEHENGVEEGERKKSLCVVVGSLDTRCTTAVLRAAVVVCDTHTVGG